MKNNTKHISDLLSEALDNSTLKCLSGGNSAVDPNVIGIFYLKN